MSEEIVNIGDRRQHLQQANTQYEKHAGQKRRDENFQVEDLVMAYL